MLVRTGGAEHAILPSLTYCMQGGMLRGQADVVLQAPACRRPHDPVHQRPQKTQCGLMGLTCHIARAQHCRWRVRLRVRVKLLGPLMPMGSGTLLD